MFKKHFLSAATSLLMLFALAQKQDEFLSYAGNKTSWHGFDRYDFLMDSIDFTILSFHSSLKEENGILEQVPGKYRCIIVVPRKAAPGSPWSWQGRYWDHQPQAEVELLHRGFHITYVMSDPGKSWDAWYRYLTEKNGLSKKPAFIGMSKGGVNEYSWATMNPDKVSCIYADNPALYPESMQRIAELARNDVPLLHICGSFDFLLEQHTIPVENLYRQMGGRISVMIKDGAAHHPHSLQDPTIIADWIEQNVQPVKNNEPIFNGIKFNKSYYYSFGKIYKYLPKENTYAECSGPLFFPCYERYDQQTGSTWGITGMTIIVPKVPAADKAWIFRANRIGREPSDVDLAFLAKGFYIVAAPVVSQAGPLQKEWDSLYTLLSSSGFSNKPVLEGTGAGAGEAYAWAILHPDRVSAIISVNPVLRSLQTNDSIVNKLNLLARAGILLINICGSDDPWINENTLAVEKRYKELGGEMKVIIHKGEGHFLSSSDDPKKVADFILQHNHFNEK
jgi:pimeloyl-ACP methyl ester carboxylesterase